MKLHLTWAVASAVSLGIGGLGAATAADLAARPVYKAPPPVVAYNWTGCYIGGYVGGAVQSRGVNAVDPSSTGGVFPVGTFYNAPNANAVNGGLFSYDLDSSVIGGGTLGCNWQGAGSPFVVGVEAEGGYMKLNGSVIVPYSVVGQGSDTTASTKIGDVVPDPAVRLVCDHDVRMAQHLVGELLPAFGHLETTLSGGGRPVRGVIVRVHMVGRP